MGNYKSLILFLTILYTTVASVLANSSLAIVIMVKNEPLIKETLQPFVDAGVKNFLVYDTGSDDNTVKIAREFFNYYGLEQAYLLEDPFIDFSASRNRALDTAEHLFPEATFILMPDAEWYLYNVEILLEFCNNHITDSHDSYALQAQYGTNNNTFHVTRLLRNHKNVRFVGKVHESLNQITMATVPKECYFEWRPTQEGINKTTQRWQRDKKLLLQSYEDDPFDPRTLFYLGQTYYCLGDLHNAYIFYKKRTKIMGWDEENFVTLLRLGDVAQDIAKAGSEHFYPIALNHYLEAFNRRPHRAEPLIKIADYYLRQNKMHCAFLFALPACKIPCPDSERLLIEHALYDQIYDILSQCAWYVKEYEIGEWAAQEALKRNPDLPHLQQNLQFYVNRRNSIHTFS